MAAKKNPSIRSRRRARNARQPTKDPETHAVQAGPEHHGEENLPKPAAESNLPGKGYLPVAVVIEILSKEYEGGAAGEALCRAALRAAEEGGVIEDYRAKWDAEEESTGHGSPLLYDRRQSLELIRYYENKGNLAALEKEKEKLHLIEGRLLLERTSQCKITDEDLEELEKYIRECGF